MRHIHADLIKAWADGAEIEVWGTTCGEWIGSSIPEWRPDAVYRIKPKPNKVTWHALSSDLLVYNACTDRELLNDNFAIAILRLEIDHNDPHNPVLVSATLEKP